MTWYVTHTVVVKNVKLAGLEGLSAIIENLFADCNVFKPDSTLRENYKISEEKLRHYVKKLC